MPDMRTMRNLWADTPSRWERVSWPRATADHDLRQSVGYRLRLPQLSERQSYSFVPTIYCGLHLFLPIFFKLYTSRCCGFRASFKLHIHTFLSSFESKITQLPTENDQHNNQCYCDNQNNLHSVDPPKWSASSEDCSSINVDIKLNNLDSYL